jgi:hypothetical protein
MIFSLGKSEPAARFWVVLALSGCSVVIIESGNGESTEG